MPLSAFDIFIHSVDIRDRSLKVSEIAPNFEHFAPPKFWRCWPPKTCTQIIIPVAKFREVTPTGPKVIMANTLKFNSPFAHRNLFSRLHIGVKNYPNSSPIFSDTVLKQ